MEICALQGFDTTPRESAGEDECMESPDDDGNPLSDDMDTPAFTPPLVARTPDRGTSSATPSATTPDAVAPAEETIAQWSTCFGPQPKLVSADVA